MTTEATTNVISAESLAAAIETARASLKTVTDAANAAAPDLLKKSDWKALGENADKIKAAEAAVEKAVAAHADFVKTSRWEQLTDARKPVQDTAGLIRDSKPTVPVTSIRGPIVIVKNEDGTYECEVSLTATLASADMADLESMLAEAVDAKAFGEIGVMSIDVNITNIGKPDALIDIKPSSAATQATRAPRGTNAAATNGSWVFDFNGSKLGSRAFLEAVEASGHAIATDRKQSFDTALRGNGNGLRNLALSVAKKMSVAATQAEKSAA